MQSGQLKKAVFLFVGMMFLVPFSAWAGEGPSDDRRGQLQQGWGQGIPPELYISRHHGKGGLIIINPGGLGTDPSVSVNGYDWQGRCVIPACQVQNRQFQQQNDYHCLQSNDGSLSCGYGKDVPPPR